jgi:hypothetical protein
MQTVQTVSDQQPTGGRVAAGDGDADRRRRLAARHGHALAAAVLRLVGDPRRVAMVVDEVLDEASAADAVRPTERGHVDAWLLALARRRLAANAAEPIMDPTRPPEPPRVVPPIHPAPAARSLRIVPRRVHGAERGIAPKRTRRLALWISALALVVAAVALVLSVRPLVVAPSPSQQRAAVLPRAMIAPERRVPPAPAPIAPAPVATSPRVRAWSCTIRAAARSAA